MEEMTLSNELVVNAKRYHELREQKRALEKQVEDIEAEKDQLGEVMKKAMEEMNLQRFNLQGIGTFYLQASFFPKVIGDPVKVIEWLDANGGEMVAPRTIGRSAFKEFYQERIEKDLTVPPTELVEASTDIGLRLRGAKA